MASGGTEGPRLVLLGTSTPLGAEVKTRLAESRSPFGDAILAELDPTDEEGGQLVSEFAGEALLVTAVDDVDFARADVAILCGEPEATAPVLERATKAGSCIDVSGAARGREGVPWVHYAVQPEESFPSSGLVAAPQPVSATLAALLKPLTSDRLVQAAVATVLLPASALGAKAAKELYQQTLGLLNFTELPQERLAQQLAFNILPWEDPARPGSGELSLDLAGEVRRLLGADAIRCHLQLLLAPTFHGYGYSLWLETAGGVSEDDIRGRFEAAGFPVSPDGRASASPAEALQQGERVLVSRVGRAAEQAVWVWAVADSLGDGAAENVVRLARHMARAAAGGRSC